MTDQELAILHDQWTARGGAEQVALELARTFDAPIYAARVDTEHVPEDVDVRPAFDRWWEKRAMDSHYLIQDFVQMFAWQHVAELHEFNTVILNKNNPGWYVPRDWQTVVKYCHSTPRQPYDRFHDHGESYITRMIQTPMRVLYEPNTTYPDAWVCNSDLVQHRIAKYWGIPEDDIAVVYPPVDTIAYDHTHANTRDYYFTLSRLEGHKNIDDIIQAFNLLDYELKIAGTGTARDSLEQQAGENIEFLGYIEEEEKWRRMAEAKAVVFAAENEDFGMVPIEAMAAGTPVIGIQDGFTQYQIEDGKNGRLFANQGGHLRETVRLFDRNGVEWGAERIQEFAHRFRSERFRSEMRAIVDEAHDETTIRPDWETEDQETERVREDAVSDGGDTA